MGGGLNRAYVHQQGKDGSQELTRDCASWLDVAMRSFIFFAVMCLFLPLMALVNNAHALVPAKLQWTTNLPPLVWHDTAEAACEEWRAWYEAGGMPSNWSTQFITTVSCTTTGGIGLWYGRRSGTLASTGAAVSYSILEVRNIYRKSVGTCPADSNPVTGGCACNIGAQEDATQTACILAAPKPPSCPRIDGLSTATPILPATAEKFRSETDWSDSGPGALSFTRTYRSNWAADPTRASNPLGQVWSHNFSTKLVATPSAAPSGVAITTGEGYVRTFGKAAGATTWTAGNSMDTLAQLPSGTWSYRRADDDTTLSFDGSGRLRVALDRNGWVTTYNYDGAGQLSTVTNGFGRTLVFGYNGAGQLTTVATPDGRFIAYAYDGAGRLVSVLYPDGKGRNFVYENASFPQGLTGIFDEAGVRWGTFAYDSQGRAISTQLAGAVDKYQVSYPASSSATVVDPLGTSRNYSYGTTLGKLAVTAGSLPSGEGKSDAANRVQDANGLITSETDFNGVITTTTWDVARRLPTAVVYAAGTPDAKTTITQWHPVFSLPVLITEPSRNTAYTYDAFGNTLSKTVTDTATNKAQLWQWTYDAQQLVETATEPNGAVTSYTYDPRGNVLTSTNALGHITSYGYDNANRVVSSTAPNGLVTTYTYDARDRLLTQAVGGQTTVC